MAHWAELDENNIVTRVLVGDNNDPNNDEGYQWLIDNLGGRWIKTSYNARNGKRVNPETNEETVDNQDLTNGDNELPLSVSSEVRKNFTRNVGNTQRRKFR